MKTINETFEDKDFEALKKFKNGHSWHDFILLMFIHCKDAEKKGDFEVIKR